MDNSLHFVVTGDNSQLIDTLEQTQRAFDNLEAVTSKYGITAGEALNLVSQHMQATSEGGQALKESIAETSQALDGSAQSAAAAGGALGDLNTKYLSLNLELRNAKTELDNMSTDNIERIQELEAHIEELKGKIAEVNSQMAADFANSGVTFEMSTGDPVEMASGDSGAIIEDNTAKAETLNNTLNETVARFNEIHDGLENSRESFEQLISTANANGGDSLRLAENNDKIDAINERLHTLDQGYAAAADACNAARAAIEQAVAEGNEEQANALQETAKKIIENKLKIEEEVSNLQKTRQQLQEENEQIRSKANQVQADAGQAAEPPVDKFAKLKEMIGQVGGSMGQMGKGFKALAGGGASAAGGLNMIATGFRGLTAAMMSNPYLAVIAAVIVAVKQLVDAFKRNEDAMTALQKIAAPFKAVWQTVQRLFDDIVKVFVNVFNNIQRITGGFSVFTGALMPFRTLITAIRLQFAVLGNTLTVVSNGIALLVEKIRSATRESSFGKWLSGIIDSVKGFFNQVDAWIKKVASSKIGKALGMDSLYENIKEIFGAQSELEEKNRQIADLENARNKKARANLIENAKHQATLTRLRREYAEAANDVAKQAEISKKITAEERAIKKNELDLAIMERDIIAKKNSLIQSGTKDLDGQARAEADVIRLQAEYENGMSSQERGTQRRVSNDEYRKLKSELDSERDLQLEAYKQQKIDARDSREELQRIEMEEFNFKQTMKKKELDLQLKYHKISQQDYELQLQQMAAAAQTHAAQVAAGNFDYFRDARIKLDNGVNKKNDQEEIKAEIDVLKEKLKYEKNVEERLRIQSVIRQKNLEIELASIENEKRNKIREVYKEEGLRQYDEGTLNDVVGVTEAYDRRKQQATDKSRRQGITEDFQEDYQAYVRYCESVIAAEEWKQQELRRIAEGESNMTEEQVNQTYDKQVADAAKYANLDSAELKLTEIAAKFQASIANATFEGIGQAMTDLEEAMTGENNLIDKILGMTDEQKTARTEELQQQIAPDQAIVDQNQATLEDEQATPEQKAAAELAIAEAEERMLDAKREILLLSYDQQQLDQQKIKNQEVLDKMINAGIDAQKAGGQVVSNTTAKSITSMKNLCTSLGAVEDMTNAVSSAFGDGMSAKAKKALEVVSGVASTAKSVISGIQNLVSVASNAMKATSASGVSAMKALETASVILTILSLAVQAITAIVKFFTQFSAEAQMQKKIDKLKASVNEMKVGQEKIEATYKSKSGSDYYKGLSNAAQNYNNLIRENKKALEEARALEDAQKSNHGDDSKKAKDATEQRQELEKQQLEFEQKQQEMYKELMEGLSGTSLQSFSQNLADSLVEGFKQGKEGINDVWDDTMNDLMRTMMKQQLAIAINDMFKPVFDQLNEYTKNGELNQSEIDAIMRSFDAQSERAKLLAEQYYNMMSERGLLEDADTEGSKGFGQMTQDQADTLTARFTALQMEGANVVAISQMVLEEMVEMYSLSERQTSLLQSIDQYQQLVFLQSQEHLDQLQIIAENTALLAETNIRLKAIEENTDKL